MGRFRKIARRTFLVGSAAIAGGVAFGVYKLEQEPPNPLTAADGEWPLNAFVVITRDGVRIVSPKAELGQGVYTTWAALVAEELDVAWDRIEVVHGPVAQAYYNSALFSAVLPVLDYRVGPVTEELGKHLGKAAKFIGLDVTGGSTSMKDGWERMRIAGATARETLKAAAARRTGLSPDQLATEDGFVVTPDGTRIAYADLAEAAAAIDPPRVTLRDPATWRYLGQSLPRLDMVPKSTGTAGYAIDLRLEGMRYATVRTSPRRGAMLSMDPTAALAMPGVERVVDLGDGFAVVATNTWLAFNAADAVTVEWGPSDYAADTAGILADLAGAFQDEPNTTPRDEGNTDKPQAGTEVVAEYTVPHLAHATMEPMSATALFDGTAVTVWSGLQAPGIAQDRVAGALGLDPQAVTIHVPYIGGGFGRRSETDFAVQAARIAQAMPGVPVKLTWTREEDMTIDYFRPAAIGRFRGVVAEGRAVLLDGRIASGSLLQDAARRSTGTQSSMPDREIAGGAYDQPYAIPHHRIAAHAARTRVPIGYWRSVGASYGGFFYDTFIDEMAHAAGADPLQFRIDMASGEHEPSARVLETVGQMSGWGEPRAQGTALGVGFVYSFGAPCAQVVQVSRRGGAIGIDKVWIAADVGVALDPRNLEAQLTGGAIFGLSAAIAGEVTFADGMAQQRNFWDYDLLRMDSAPAFEVRILQDNRRLSGIGEVGTPPAAPALGNALFALTGERARELPLRKRFDLVI